MHLHDDDHELIRLCDEVVQHRVKHTVGVIPRHHAATWVTEAVTCAMHVVSVTRGKGRW